LRSPRHEVGAEDALTDEVLVFDLLHLDALVVEDAANAVPTNRKRTMLVHGEKNEVGEVTFGSRFGEERSEQDGERQMSHERLNGAAADAQTSKP
jgi:hypothetical protein